MQLRSALHPGIVFCIAVILGSTACSQRAAAPTTVTAPAADFQIEDLKAGEGEAVTAGRIALVEYTGWLYESAAPDHKGAEFDSSHRTGQPFRFPLGAGRVIKGWDQGVAGMRVGGRRRLTVPPALAYGDDGAGGVIPPGATLIFEVDLVGIE